MIMILNNEIEVKLGELRPGERAEIIGFCIEDEMQDYLLRLFEVGFILGETIEVIQEAPLSHDPISIRVKDAVYALRRDDANLIRVVKKAG